MLKSLAVLLLLLMFFLAPSRALADGRISNNCLPVSSSETMVHPSFPAVTYDIHRQLRYVSEEKGFLTNRPCFGVIRDESAVVFDGSWVYMTAKGDVCSALPVFIFYNAQDLYGVYPSYVSTGQLTRDPMVQRIAAAIAITSKRCGVTPVEMKFIARRARRDFVSAPQDRRGRYNRLRETTAEAAFTDFFSGRVVKEADKYKLISDDPAQEEAFYRRITANYNAGVRAEQQRALNFALGAAVGMMMLGGGGNQVGNSPAGVP